MKFIVKLLLLLFIGDICAIAKEKSLIQLEEYLLELKSVAIDFNQIDSEGIEASGRIIVVRPYNFLCNYYPPYPIIIGGNSSFINIYDYDLKQLTLINREESPLTSLLTDPKKFLANLEFKGSKHDKTKLIYHFFNKELGSNIYVTYDLQKKMLVGIRINEFDNKYIKLDISKIVNITDVEKNLFIFRDPNLHKPKKRLNANELAKKYREL